MLFLLIFIISLIIFLTIYYIAINKSYIVVSPETIIKKEARNFILSPNTQSSILGNNNTVQLERISKKIYSSHMYSATNLQYKGNAVSQ